MRKRQLNVQEQIALRRHAIRKIALAYQAGGPDWHWVTQVLQQSGLLVQGGILVDVAVAPWYDPDMDTNARWLTRDGRFYAIEAIAHLHTGELIEIERCEDVTVHVEISRHVPGTGKSFGWLALEVLQELTGDPPHPLIAATR